MNLCLHIKSAAKVHKKNDIRKNVCHFFGFLTGPYLRLDCDFGAGAGCSLGS